MTSSIRRPDVGSQRTAEGADDPRRDRVLQPERVADRDHYLAHADIPRASERRPTAASRRRWLRSTARSVPASRPTTSARSDRAVRQHRRHPLGSGDYVAIGQDQTVRREDNPRAVAGIGLILTPPPGPPSRPPA